MRISSSDLGWDIALPPDDFALSPETGITREHWAIVADNLLLAVRPYRSPLGGQIDLPGRPARAGPRSDGLEGFARTFLLAAIRVAGDEGADAHGFLPQYLEGMIAGTRAGETPGETWQPINDTGPGGQPMVESASIALGLHLTRAWTWDLLTGPQQDGVEAWLRGALIHEPAANNWYLFPLTVANFLESVGRGDAATAAAIDRGFELIESWYRGDGWYSDGAGRSFDNYIGWALHFYPVMFAFLRERDRAGRNNDQRGLDKLEQRGLDKLDQRGVDRRATTLHTRLGEFLKSFTLTFDRNGSPLYLGRSLTYRIATVTSIALGEVAGCSPLRAGQSRLLLSRTLRWFLENGALSGGILSRGWLGPHEATLQPYSGPASPYWASKGFVGLLLPPRHPLWTSIEESLDTEDADTIRDIAPVGWLVQRTGRDGIARVHNHGSDNLAPEVGDGGPPNPLYARFAYSTRTGPTAARNISDNDVQVTFRGVTSVRRRIVPLGSGPDWAASSHAPRFPLPMPISGGGAEGMGPRLPGARIDSLVVARGSWEVRICRFVGIPHGLAVRNSGWALAAASPAEFSVAISPIEPELSTADARDTATGTPPADSAPRLAGISLRSDQLVSELIGAVGWTAAESARAPQGTAYGAYAVVPALTGVVGPGFFVAFARLTETDVADPPAVAETPDGLDIRWTDGTHRVTWPGDHPSVEWTAVEWTAAAPSPAPRPGEGTL